MGWLGQGQGGWLAGWVGAEVLDQRASLWSPTPNIRCIATCPFMARLVHICASLSVTFSNLSAHPNNLSISICIVFCYKLLLDSYPLITYAFR